MHIHSTKDSATKMAMRGMYCRTCLCVLHSDFNHHPLVYNIFNTVNLAKKLTDCSNTRIDTNDQFPHSVCKKCYEIVLDFYEFQKMCRESLKMFDEIHGFENDLEEALGDSNYFKVPRRRIQKEIPILRNDFYDSQYNSKSSETSDEFVKPHIETAVGLDAINIESIAYSSESKQEQCEEAHAKPSEETYKGVSVDHDIDEEYREQQENDFLLPNVDNVLNEIDVYTTNDNLDNFEDNLFGLLEQNEKMNKLDNTEKYVHDNMKVSPDEKQNSDTSSLRVTRSVTRLELINQNQLSQDDENSEDERALKEMPNIPQKNLRFICSVCSKKFRFHHTLVAHERWHSGLPGYPCYRENCKRSFERYHDLQDHLRDHDGVEREVFKCEIEDCDREFARKLGLSLHMKKVHNCKPAKLKYVCEICGKAFKTDHKLREHSFTHQDKSTWLYTCDVDGCKQKCRTWMHMKIHKNRHAGIRKFICPYCGAAKTTSQELKSHINFHTLVRTWPCKHCTKVCKTLANFNRHMKNKHSGSNRNFKCKFCEATFGTVEVLKSHEKHHTSNRPHKCDECGMGFIWAYKLKHHLKTHM